MLCYQELYGADADGNRGQLITWADLEPSDSEDIRQQILEQYQPDSNEYTVVLYCYQFDTEHEFDVLASNYFTPTELEEFNDDFTN
jgi:hypothetical protein